MKGMTRISSAHITTMISALTQQPMTYDALAQVSGLSKEAVTRWVKNVRGGPDGGTGPYISDWLAAKDGTLRVRAYRWGVQEDAPRPGARRSNAERMKLLRAKRKAAV